MCANPFKKQKINFPKAGSVPQLTDRKADAAAEKERQRLRLMTGRASTILTAGNETLGKAPVAVKTTLGA